MQLVSCETWYLDCYMYRPHLLTQCSHYCLCPFGRPHCPCQCLLLGLTVPADCSVVVVWSVEFSSFNFDFFWIARLIMIIMALSVPVRCGAVSLKSVAPRCQDGFSSICDSVVHIKLLSERRTKVTYLGFVWFRHLTIANDRRRK